MRKPIIVSGANGFTGRYVCLELIKQNIPFIALLRPKTNNYWFKSMLIECRYADLFDQRKLSQELKGCGALINIASIGFGNINIIIDSCKKSGIKRVIFISTTAIFTNLNVKSKNIRKKAELAIKKSKLEWTILRPTMIYGSPKDRNIIRLIRWIDKYPILPIFGNGNYMQQPVFVKDIAWSVIEVLKNPKTTFQDFNLSGKSPLTYNSMISIIEKSLSKRIFKIFISSRIPIILISVFEKFNFKFFIKSEQIKRLNENKTFSHKKAFSYFGYSPKSFEIGVKNEIDLYKKVEINIMD